MSPLEILSADFEATSKICTQCFKEVYKLRNKLQKPTPLLVTDLEFLSKFFNEKTKSEELPDEVMGLCEEYIEKKINFFSAHIFPRGIMISKGNIDFIKYAIENPNEFGLLTKYLSKMETQMRVAWYGILQKYGKTIIHLTKIEGQQSQRI